MDRLTFEHLVFQFEGLTAEQRQEARERLQKISETEDGKRLIEECIDAESVRCPHCSDKGIVKFGKMGDLQRYRCKGCTKTFTALTGTPVNYLKDKKLLLANAKCMAEGLTIRKVAARLGITVDRAFRWRHKFLSFLNEQKPSGLTGIVEADETFFRRSFKGQRKYLPRAPKKRGSTKKSGENNEKVAVVVVRQRGTRLVYDKVLSSQDATALTAALRPALSSDAVLSTDGNPSYGVVARELGIEAGSFVSSYHGKGGKGSWHVQGVNRYDGSLKNWMNRFHGVATKYLPNYLGWRRLLDRLYDAVTPHQFLFHVLRKQYINF